MPPSAYWPMGQLLDGDFAGGSARALLGAIERPRTAQHCLMSSGRIVRWSAALP